MSDVATRLRSAREEAGLSIEDLSARTKIKPAQLLALERGDYEQLLGEFFTRAFLRTYARELRLPVGEVMADYDRDVTPVATIPRRESTDPVWHTSPAELEERSGARRMWSVLALAALVAVALFALNGTTPEIAGEPGAVGTSGVTAPAPVPVATLPSALPPAPPAETIRIDIQPTRPVWVTGIADGERVLYRQLEAGEKITLEAQDRLSFRVGDAGAFAFSLNGAATRRAGRDGEVREFTITRDNLPQ